VNEQTRNDIIARLGQGQSMRSIAQALGISRGAVSRAVRGHQAQREQGAGGPARPRRRRSSLLDPFAERIGQLLDRYPNITVERLLQELRAEGYEGGYTILREHVKSVRGSPRAAEVVRRFETAPGMQAQMDWAVYTIDFTDEGRRRVNLFSYLLGYSRRQYLHFTDSQDLTALRREHVRAFEHLGGVAAECLYDNMKTVVDRWEDEAPIYNTRFLAFATHYGFRPRACRPGRPQTKGKVERPFHYVETSLLNGRSFRSLEHLNEVTAWWLENVADVRQHRVLGKTPREAWQEEQPHLLALPAAGYDTARVVYRVVDVEGFVAYERNAYSVPWRLVGELLVVRVTERELIAYNSSLEVIARHELFPRSVKGARREERAHRPSPNRREQLAELQQRYAELGEAAQRFLEGLLAAQAYGKHQARKVLSLLALYHRRDVLAAMERATRYRAFSFSSLERILAVRAKPKRLPPSLADSYRSPFVDDDPIHPRPTTEYQPLLFGESTDDQKQDDAPADHEAPGEEEGTGEEGDAGAA
jgi:transposase